MTGIAANLRTNAEVVLRSDLPMPKKRAILLRLSRQVALLNTPSSAEAAASSFSLYEDEREDLHALSREMETALSRMGVSAP